MAPKDENEFQHMIKMALDCCKPVAIRYPRGKGVGVRMERPLQSICIGKGELLREGGDLVILAIGSTVYPTLHAAERLKEEGIHAAVINSRFLKPLDADLICRWAKRTGGRILTVEENVLQGGFGSAILELLQEQDLSSLRVKRLGIPDLFVEHGPQSLLRAKYGIDEDGIVKGAKKLLGRQWKASEYSNERTSLSRTPPNPK
jgi:1-deoxy-D-xylulose-5-phosphate synthase